MTIGVIVVAAGSGTRLGAGRPKAFVHLAGWPMLTHALVRVFGSAEPAAVVVVAPEAELEEARSVLELTAGESGAHTGVVVGGATRHESVARGLAALPPSVDVVLVHDAARPLTPSALFDRVVGEVRATGDGVIPVLPVADTIKRVVDGSVIETVDRSELGAVQTPQGFPRDMLEAAYAQATRDETDDAGVVARAGFAVRAIEGDDRAFKITTPWDLNRADLLLGPDWDISQSRVGIGVDVHAFGEPGTPLWLAGLYWPGERGLAGHSDGDVVSHAIVDAILSAAGLGDIGSVFGTSDARYAGAHGEVFLREVAAMLDTGAGWRIRNVSVQLIGNSPRLGPRRHEAQSVLMRALGCAVSVTATTTDGLGLTGRGEGLAAIATAYLTAHPGLRPLL